MTDLLGLLQEFYRDKLTIYLRHEAGARLVQQYDANNTYQYIINRDDVQLTWVAKAIEELGGTVPEVAELTREPQGKPAAAALAGRVDLLGRRQINLEPARGEVLPSRWIE